MPRIAHIEIRTDPPQVSGSYTRYIIPPQERGWWSATHALNGESRASLTLPTDAEAWSHVRRMDCLRVVYEDGSSRSWRVADDTLTEDERTGELVLSASEILLDLADCRVLRNERTAGAPQLSRTFAIMSPTEILSDVLHELHDAGEALHIQIGTVEPTAMIAHDRAWTTALEVVRGVATHSRVACEYRLREEQDAFYLDLLQRVGNSALPVHVWYQGDLGALRRQRSSSQVASVVIPRGEGEGVLCGATVFEVTQVTSTYVRVRDPDAPGAPALVFDDQFRGAYALRPVDGAACEITASLAGGDQRLYVAGASGFVVGDIFELRRDTDGNRLVTRENPAALRARHLGGIGRVERVVPVDGAHAARNYVKNPFFRDWSAVGGGAYVPTGWSVTGGYNARRQGSPGAPSGTGALLRPLTSVRVAQELAAGARALSGGIAGGYSHAALFRPGEQWEMRAVSGGALLHTVTITSASYNAVMWAEATPALYAANSVDLVLKAGYAGIRNGGAGLTASRIFPPRDVTTVSIGALVYSPSAYSGVGPRAVRLSYRKNGAGVYTQLYAPTAGAWQVLSAVGIAHAPGDYYDVAVAQTLPALQSEGAAALMGEVQWLYFGEGAELPPHDLASGAFAVPEYSNSNRLHRIGQASLIRMAPDRASYALDLVDLRAEDGAAVPADRFTLGGTVVMHHARLATPVRARLLTITEREDAPESPALTLDSVEPDVARTLALLLGAGGTDAGAGTSGAAGGPWPITVVASPDDGGFVSGAGRYVTGRLVEARAVPATNHIFRQWTVDGVAVSSLPDYDFRASAARVLVAEFEAVPSGSYTITVTVSPAGGGTVTGAGSHASGATVTLKATAASGYAFKRWTVGGVAVSTGSTYSFTASADRALVAEFEAVPPGSSTISLSVSPSGAGTVSGAGSYTNGTLATVAATSAAGYQFARWTEAGTVVSTSASHVFTVTVGRALVAEFEPLPPDPWVIAVTVSPAGAGAVSGAGSYAPGASVALNAAPTAGYRFKRWTEGGTVVGLSFAYSFTASADRTLVAEFEVLRAITATVSPAGTGSVTGTGGYPDGATVTLRATPAAGYQFKHWTTPGGAFITASAERSFTVVSDDASVAVFEPAPVGPWTISVSVSPAGAGSVFGAGSYADGDAVYLAAAPKGMASFVRWTELGAELSTDPNLTFTARFDRVLVAEFTS